MTRQARLSAEKYARLSPNRQATLKGASPETQVILSLFIDAPDGIAPEGVRLWAKRNGISEDVVRDALGYLQLRSCIRSLIHDTGQDRLKLTKRGRQVVAAIDSERPSFNQAELDAEEPERVIPTSDFEESYNVGPGPPAFAAV